MEFIIQLTLFILILATVVTAYWFSFQGRVADSSSGSIAGKSSRLKKHVVYTVVSVVFLVISAPIMMLLTIGIGMSPGSPHVSNSEFAMVTFCPFVVLVMQIISFRTLVHTVASKVIGLVITSIASLEMLYVTLAKWAG